MKTRKKLIEVALPLQEINEESAREKSIRHGHPSTLHLWWARRPLAAARAVIFAQMVDDPSAVPEEFPTPEAQERERARLFSLLQHLVKWENTQDEELLSRAREEIWKSWRRTCADNREHPKAREWFDPDRLPGFHDPFAGGGSLPLEAQRLGLQAHASDLNPVAVTINKAMIEIPPRFAHRAPVGPVAESQMPLGTDSQWRGARGLAEDVRRYGAWMREKAQARIGHLYPPVKITPQLAQDRPDLQGLVGQELTVIAWLWARTVKSPNPAFSHVEVPLASTFVLAARPGREAYVEPVIEGDAYRFTVKVAGSPGFDKAAYAQAKSGTTAGKRAAFICLLSKVPIDYKYIRNEGQAGRMGARLMAIVAEGPRGRVYLPPIPEHEAIARQAQPEWQPDVKLPDNPRDFKTPNYGLPTFGDLFTPRQLVALTTFSDLVGEAIEKCRQDALAAGWPDDGVGLEAGGTGATAYAQAVGVYLGLGVSRLANRSATLNFWDTTGEKIQQVFARQALPMTWDFVEGSPLSSSSGNFVGQLEYLCRVLERVPAHHYGFVIQSDAQTQTLSRGKAVSTDPPYYDNVGYADLSDFFYVWLRRTLRPVFPGLYATLAVPKAEELVATPYRHGSKEAAEAFFLEGMRRALKNLAEQAHPAFPVTIYYAFKQSETTDDAGTTSTGWETFLQAVIEAGFSITGTWPMRTEYTGNLKKGTNALASSIVLVCRHRAPDAPAITRRQFLDQLRAELHPALRNLQTGHIAPVDLAQAALGPGMAVYSRHQAVQDSSGQDMPVKEALSRINQALDELLAEQEGDFDADTRWALVWFEQHGFSEGEYGEAEILAKAKNTSIAGLVEAGFLLSKRGKVRLLAPGELPADWEPETDARLTHWEAVHYLIRALDAGGETAAAKLADRLGPLAEIARELAYRLYHVCERRKWASEALAYNALVQSWPEIQLANAEKKTRYDQPQLF